jgi:hypothetical protein
MDPDMDLKRRQSIDNTVVSPNTPENTPHHKNLINQNALKLHLKLAHSIKPELWRTIDSLATIKDDKEYEQATPDII